MARIARRTCSLAVILCDPSPWHLEEFRGDEQWDSIHDTQKNRQRQIRTSLEKRFCKHVSGQQAQQVAEKVPVVCYWPRQFLGILSALRLKQKISSQDERQAELLNKILHRTGAPALHEALLSSFA